MRIAWGATFGLLWTASEMRCYSTIHSVAWMGRRTNRKKCDCRSWKPLRGGSEDSLEPTNADQPPTSTKKAVFLVMDGFCPYHGGYLANMAAHEYPGVAVVPILSDYVRGFLKQQDPDEAQHWDSMKVPETDQEWQAWKEQFMGDDGDAIEKIAVYCESDSGLAQAESLRQQLSERFGDSKTKVLCDEPVQLEARRHKYLMNQVVAERSGLATVQQRFCQSLDEARVFAQELLAIHKAVVVKPYRGVASESVALCSSMSQVEQAWERITSSTVFGAREQHDSVLVQEYLQGVEYAVDVVSRNGQHKVAAIWKYDKRPANGAAFCYYQTKLVDAKSDLQVKAICDYVETTLSALGVQWGISHNEVILTDARGPVLVEVNCRQHNMDFCPLTMSCIGYNAFDMLLEAYFGQNWDEYPSLPSLRAHGCMVHLVNSATGRLVHVHHVQALANLSSILDWEIYEDFQTPGSLLEPTTDIRSDAGWVQLVNENAQILQQDYDQILSWMPSMFQVESSVGLEQ